MFFININLLANKKDILIIESYHAQFPWDKSYKEGIKEVLGSKYNLTFFEMNTKRLSPDKYENSANLAWEQYTSINPELVILGDDNALKYLGQRFLKTKTKVVYLGINNNPRKYRVTGYNNISGVLERPLLKRSLIFISKLLDVKKALILFDSGTTAKVISKEVFKNKNSTSIRGIQVDIVLNKTFDNWKQKVINAKKDGYDMIFIALYHTIKDNQGKHVNADEILKWTSIHSSVPPFAFWDFAVGAEKTIGGYVLFGKTQGIAAANIALKMLNEPNHGLIMPHTSERGRFLFSKKQLKNWNLHPEEKIDGTIEYIK